MLFVKYFQFSPLLGPLGVIKCLVPANAVSERLMCLSLSLLGWLVLSRVLFYLQQHAKCGLVGGHHRLNGREFEKTSKR